jgi:6-phospho-3-hexuloisomerase
MKIKDWLATDLAEVGALLDRVSEEQCEALVRAITSATRVFVSGQGRSGHIMRLAAIRLMQVGLTVHVAGDATTPPIRQGDLLLIASGSGETPTPLNHARRASAAGARVASITAQPASTIASLCDVVVSIPGETTKVNLVGKSRMPLAAALEQATLIVLDVIVARLAEEMGQTQSSMMARHANLE